MAAFPPTTAFEGQEYPLFSKDHLDKLVRDALKQRALNLRDAVGKDRLPVMPRHPEGLVRWILDVQVTMSGLTLSDFGLKEDGGAALPQPPPSSSPSSRGPGAVQFVAAPAGGGGEANDAFLEAKAARAAAQLRNRGSGIF